MKNLGVEKVALTLDPSAPALILTEGQFMIESLSESRGSRYWDFGDGHQFSNWTSELRLTVGGAQIVFTGIRKVVDDDKVTFLGHGGSAVTLFIDTDGIERERLTKALDEAEKALKTAKDALKKFMDKPKRKR